MLELKRSWLAGRTPHNDIARRVWTIADSPTEKGRPGGFGRRSSHQRREDMVAGFERLQSQTLQQQFPMASFLFIGATLARMDVRVVFHQNIEELLLGFLRKSRIDGIGKGPFRRGDQMQEDAFFLHGKFAVLLIEDRLLRGNEVDVANKGAPVPCAHVRDPFDAVLGQGIRKVSRQKGDSQLLLDRVHDEIGAVFIEEEVVEAFSEELPDAQTDHLHVMGRKLEFVFPEIAQLVRAVVGGLLVEIVLAVESDVAASQPLQRIHDGVVVGADIRAIVHCPVHQILFGPDRIAVELEEQMPEVGRGILQIARREDDADTLVHPWLEPLFQAFAKGMGKVAVVQDTLFQKPVAAGGKRARGVFFWMLRNRLVEGADRRLEFLAGRTGAGRSVQEERGRGDRTEVSTEDPPPVLDKIKPIAILVQMPSKGGLHRAVRGGPSPPHQREQKKHRQPDRHWTMLPRTIRTRIRRARERS